MPIYRTSARTGAGLPELCAGVLRDVETQRAGGASDKEPYFFERWVRDE